MPPPSLIRKTISMFQSLKRDRGGSCPLPEPSTDEVKEFQSLKRDRGGSCQMSRPLQTAAKEVSIPQTG